MLHLIILFVLLLTVFPKVGTDHRPKEKPKILRQRDRAFRKDRRQRALSSQAVREDKDGNVYVNSKTPNLYPVLMRLRFLLRPKMRIRGGYREFRLLRTKLFAGRKKISLPLVIRYWDFLSYKHIGRPLYVPVLFVLCLCLYLGWVHHIGDIIGVLGVFPIAGMALGGLNHPQIAVVENATPNTEITAAVAIGAKEIHFDPTITYTVSVAITDDLSDTIVDGHGANITHTSDVHIFNIAGTKGANRILNANADSKQTTIVITGIGYGFAADDRFLIEDDETLYGTTKKAEIVVALTVAEGGGNTTITALTPLIYDYTTADNAILSLLTMRSNITFTNFYNTGNDGSADLGNAIRCTYCENVTIRDSTNTGFGETTYLFRVCKDVKVDNIYAEKSYKAGTGYGVAWVDACFNVSVTSSSFYRCNHGVTHGASLGVGYVQYSNTYACLFSYANFDTHAEVGESVIVNTCFIDAANIHNRCIGCRGGNVTVSNCRLAGSSEYGIRTEDDCFDMTISNTTIKDCALDGIFFDAGATGAEFNVVNTIILRSGNYGIRTDNYPNLNIINCTIKESQYAGMNLTELSSGVIEGNIVKNNGLYGGASNYGIYLTVSTNSVVANNVVVDTQGVHTQGGIQVNNTSSNLNIKGNIVLNSKTRGIMVEGAVGGQINTRIQIDDNTVIGSVNSGIRLDGDAKNQKCSIRNNTLTGNDWGIYCHSNYVIISGNHIEDNLDDGIVIIGDYCLIEGNYILNNAQYGIDVNALSSYTKIGTNTITGNVSGPLLDSGTNTIYPAKEILIPVFDSDEDCATGDGTMGIGIGSELNAWMIKNVRASVYTKGVTGTMDIQIRRVRAGATVDVLSTKVTVGDEYTVADGVINAANDDLATGDLLFVDVDTTHTTPAKGLSIIIKCGEI